MVVYSTSATTTHNGGFFGLKHFFSEAGLSQDATEEFILFEALLMGHFAHCLIGYQGGQAMYISANR
jgi:hypothetical protein